MKYQMSFQAHNLPLCVDLDGTLARTDTLHEGMLRALKRSPLAFLKALPLAFRNKAAFKRRIAQIAPVRPETLPLNEDLVAYIREQQTQGRQVDLVSAADQSVVDAVAERLPVFDHVQGSDGATNLSGARKLDAIRARHGDQFVYAGDSPVDRPIWQGGQGAIVVGSGRFARSAGDAAQLEAHFPRDPLNWRAVFRALRPHQWAKNLLILVPLLLAGPAATGGEFLASVMGFVAFSFVASAGYIFNDLMDLDADRRHPTKCRRAFAAGDLTPAEGAMMFGGLLGLAAIISGFLGAAFAATCLLYFCGTLMYSFWLKRKPLVDILALASLYTVRIVAGTTLAAGAFSFWIFTFSMFIFASLAILKRYTELADEQIHETVRKSRGYTATDLPLLLPFGAGCSVASALLFVIYLVEERFPSSVYSRPEMLWLIFPILLLWQMHMWRAAVHGKVHEDPVLFAIKNRVSQMLGVLSAVIVVLSW